MKSERAATTGTLITWESQDVLCEGYSVSRVNKLQCSAATRISSASEWFAAICGYWRHHMKPTVHVLGIHLPGQKIVLTSGPGDALERIDIQALLKDISVARSTVRMTN
jgi:hypothetical protein